MKRLIGVLLLSTLAVAACSGGDDTAGAPTVPGTPLPTDAPASGDAGGTVMAPIGETMTVAALLEAEGTGPYSVEGYLFVYGDGRIVLSDAIAESYPPQPGGATIEVEGVNLQTVPLIEPTGDGLADVQWTEAPIELIGSMEGGVFFGSTPASI